MTSNKGFWPRFVNALVRGTLRATGATLTPSTLKLASHDDLHEALDEVHREGDFDKQDRDRLSGLFDLEELEVSDVMVHRMAVGAGCAA